MFEISRRSFRYDREVQIHTANEDRQLRAVKAEERRVKYTAKIAAATYGQIYYVRLNDTIKIGWTSNMWNRMQAYTVGAELLAHHPGSRADERDLHRSFKPCRVHGREWYDGSSQIILDHVANMLDEYGPPQFQMERHANLPSQAARVPVRAVQH